MSKKEVLEEVVKNFDRAAQGLPPMGGENGMSKIVAAFDFDEAKAKTLEAAMFHVLSSDDYKKAGKQVTAAAAKVVLYHTLLPEREAASEKISGVVADYCNNHKDKSPKELRNDIFAITSPVIFNAPKKEKETANQLLKDTSAKIVDTFGDKAASIGFKERVGKIWRSFTDMLPTLLSASKTRDKLHGYVAGPATAAHQRASGNQKEAGQGR